jgi:hypothetical protein
MDERLQGSGTSGAAFSGHEMSFVWRGHFVAACINPPSEAAREAAEAKGWTLFELPETAATGVPDAMISMFRGTVR